MWTSQVKILRRSNTAFRRLWRAQTTPDGGKKGPGPSSKFRDVVFDDNFQWLFCQAPKWTFAHQISGLECFWYNLPHSTESQEVERLKPSAGSDFIKSSAVRKLHQHHWRSTGRWWDGNTWYSRGRLHCWCHWCVFRCNTIGMPEILLNNLTMSSVVWVWITWHKTARADDFMPSVMTCANYLKLPEWAMFHVWQFVISSKNPSASVDSLVTAWFAGRYSSFEILKQKLDLAMREGSGHLRL